MPIWLGHYVEPEISEDEIKKVLSWGSSLSVSLEGQPPVDWSDCDFWKLVELFGTNRFATLWNDRELPLVIETSPELALVSEYMKSSFQSDVAIRAWKAL